MYGRDWSYYSQFPGFLPFTYNWEARTFNLENQQIEFTSGQTTIYCRSEIVFLRLITSWNNPLHSTPHTIWKYYT